MSLKELGELAVKSKAEDNAHLYLWVTNSFMVEAHQLARQWGFEPKTIITWVKKKADGTPSMKMGYYYRGATEHALFCVRGSLRLKGPPHPTAFETPRLPHSMKPDYFYEMVEKQSEGPYLELFSRKKRERWAIWGNELPNDVQV
jgi:N6-adenosine-specific RNA methylase IME4